MRAALAGAKTPAADVGTVTVVLPSLQCARSPAALPVVVDLQAERGCGLRGRMGQAADFFVSYTSATGNTPS